MGFKILQSKSLSDLERIVTENLKKGFELHGDIFITKDGFDNSPLYCQAVIKRNFENRYMSLRYGEFTYEPFSDEPLLSKEEIKTLLKKPKDED